MNNKRIYFEDDDGTKYVLIKEGDVYKLGRYAGDVRMFLYEYRATNLRELLKQYPFIVKAAKDFQFGDELEKLLTETTNNECGPLKNPY